MTYREKIVNITTGEEVLRDYTSEEIAEVEAAQAEALIKAQIKAEAAAARAALLAKLGITEEEAALLLS